MNECVVIIFGATGDLAKRKLIPALYSLVAYQKIRIGIVGVAYDAVSVPEIFEQARPYIANFDATIFQQLQECFVYRHLNFTDAAAYVRLAQVVEEVEQRQKLSGNRLFYLATSADFFCTITQNLATEGLAKKLGTSGPWHRIVYEKPFGHDLHSAQEINACIARLYHEAQIFRIDHYLTKELVGNIALVRFTNCVLEPLWNKLYIDNVQIFVQEPGGIEGRGAYYDRYGALRDMMQNHLLELAALIGMESPERLTGEYIRSERAKVLERIKVHEVLTAQYDGYRQEQHVAPGSMTETFALLFLTIENHRWSGVPFYLMTGKLLQKKETVIHIKFKQVDCLLARHCPSEPNYLTIQIAPEATFFLSLNVKKPGVSDEVTPVKMEFCHEDLFAGQTLESYEVIFEEIMRGEQSISVRFDEIESAWRIIDRVEENKGPLYYYQPGSKGPQEIEHFARKHGIKWRW